MEYSLYAYVHMHVWRIPGRGSSLFVWKKKTIFITWNNCMNKSTEIFAENSCTDAETEYNKSQVIHQKCLFHKKGDYIIYYNILLSYNQFYIKKNWQVYVKLVKNKIIVKQKPLWCNMCCGRLLVSTFTFINNIILILSILLSSTYFCPRSALLNLCLVPQNRT